MKNKIAIVGVILLIFLVIQIYRNHQEKSINEKLMAKKTYCIDLNRKIIHKNNDCAFMNKGNLGKIDLSIYDIRMTIKNEGYKECDSCSRIKH